MLAYLYDKYEFNLHYQYLFESLQTVSSEWTHQLQSTGQENGEVVTYWKSTVKVGAEPLVYARFRAPGIFNEYGVVRDSNPNFFRFPEYVYQNGVIPAFSTVTIGCIIYPLFITTLLMIL